MFTCLYDFLITGSRVEAGHGAPMVYYDSAIMGIPGGRERIHSVTAIVAWPLSGSGSEPFESGSYIRVQGLASMGPDKDMRVAAQSATLLYSAYDIAMASIRSSCLHTIHYLNVTGSIVHVGNDLSTPGCIVEVDKAWPRSWYIGWVSHQRILLSSTYSELAFQTFLGSVWA